jgi:hypothetical protein
MERGEREREKEGGERGRGEKRNKLDIVCTISGVPEAYKSMQPFPKI